MPRSDSESDSEDDHERKRSRHEKSDKKHDKSKKKKHGKDKKKKHDKERKHNDKPSSSMLRPQRVSSQWRTNPTLESFAQPLRLTERSKEQLENLWRVLNKNEDDRIDYDDFVGLADHDQDLVVARRRWQEMSTHFDSDRNGHITPIEFIEGFKALGLRRPLDLEGSFRSMPRTHAEFQRALNDSVNRELQNLMLKVYTDLASNEPVNPGPPSSIWRTDAHLEVIGQSTGQWLFVGTENKLLIEQIFGALDANKDGNINVNDFRPAAERPARSELWDVLRTHFDGDSNGVISLDEFVDLFKKRALTLSCVPFRSAPTTASCAPSQQVPKACRQVPKACRPTASSCRRFRVPHISAKNGRIER